MPKEQETNGNAWQASHQRIMDAVSVAGKRAALAHEVGISEGQLSKYLSGDFLNLCKALDALGLEIYPIGYVTAFERILKEKL